MIDVQGTLNTSGAPNLINIDIVKTAAGPGRAFSYKVGGVEKFYVDLDGNIATTGTITGVAAITSIPAGVIFPHAGNTVPGGYLECDGAAVSRVTYAGLFAAIGGLYGVGDGSTTFNVPDFRGRTLVGAGTGPGLTNRVLASQIGEENHVLTVAELAAHAHGVNDPTHTHQYLHLTSGNDAQVGATGDIVTGFVIEATTASPTGVTIQNAGSGAGHNTMQPGSVVKFIIKV
jgi:microcystin-dependent protein